MHKHDGVQWKLPINAIEVSSAGDIAAIDAAAQDRTKVAAEDRIQCLGTARGNGVVKHAATDRSDDKACCAVTPPATIVVVAAPIETITGVELLRPA